MSHPINRAASERRRGETLARVIYQDLLDRIGLAIERNSFDQYRGFFQLPHRMETFETRQIIESDAQLERLFNGIVERLRHLGSNGLSRHCTMAEFASPTLIRGCHETYVVSQDSLIKDSYSALSTLVLVGTDWLVADSQYVEPHASIPTDVMARSKHNT